MLVSSILALATGAAAANIKVLVGQGGLTFTPDTIAAAKGDVVEFHFVGGYHDAVNGDFANPCTPGPTAGGFSSGTFQGATTNTNVFKVTVNSTDPTFLFCSVGAHCANGMVAAINPTADKTVAAFRAAAKGKTAKRPVGSYGGVLSTE